MEFPEFYEAKKPPEWATFCPDRRPNFKVHTSKGLAHSAIGYHKPQSEIAMYHLEVINGEAVWQKVWEYTFPSSCPSCGKDFKPERGYSSKYCLEYRFEGTIKDAPVVCYECHSAGYDRAARAYRVKKELETLEALKRLYPDA